MNTTQFKRIDYDRSYLPSAIRTLLKNSHRKLKVLEIGVEYGGYLDVYYPQLYDVVERFYLVDLWQTEGNDAFFSSLNGQVERGYERVKSLYGSNPQIRMCKGSSAEWAKKFEDEYFDWIYIDGDHTKEAVLEDIKAWYPKLRKGGIISGHDIDADPKNEAWEAYKGFDVAGAVRDFFGEKSKDVYVTNERHYKTWLYVKPRETKVNLVTALYNISREGLDGRKWESYLSWFEKTLKVNCPMTVFCEPETKAFVEKHRQGLPTRIHTCSLEDIPLYHLKSQIDGVIQSPAYKQKMENPDRIECKSAEYNMTQYSKFEWLKQASNENAFGAEYYVWIDAGISRFIDKKYDFAANFPGENGLKMLEDAQDRLLIQMTFPYFPYFLYASSLDENYFWHYAHFLVGAMFGGTKKSIEEVGGKIINILKNQMLAKQCINNEQIALGYLLKKELHIFAPFYDDGENHLQLFNEMAECLSVALLPDIEREKIPNKYEEWLTKKMIFANKHFPKVLIRLMGGTPAKIMDKWLRKLHLKRRFKIT